MTCILFQFFFFWQFKSILLNYIVYIIEQYINDENLPVVRLHPMIILFLLFFRERPKHHIEEEEGEENERGVLLLNENEKGRG